jgi:glycosyl transferase family 25
MSNKIDLIVYINLNKRTDRKNQIEKNLNFFQLKYERFEAIEQTDFCALGCALSHLSVLKLAKERNLNNVLIMEDDFEFIVSKQDFETNLETFFNSNLNWDVCFLSYNISKYIDLGDASVVNKVVEAQTASGYIVHKHYYNKLIDLFEMACYYLKYTKQHWLYANDVVWKPLQKTDNWFYFKQRIGKQREGYSDNAGCYVNYLC